MESLIGTGLVFNEVQADLENQGYKYRRVLPKLVPLELYTDEIGLGLLPTPNTTGLDGGSNSRKANKTNGITAHTIDKRLQESSSIF